MVEIDSVHNGNLLDNTDISQEFTSPSKKRKLSTPTTTIRSIPSHKKKTPLRIDVVKRIKQKVKNHRMRR
jgi:hypothetical protein